MLFRKFQKEHIMKFSHTFLKPFILHVILPIFYFLEIVVKQTFSIYPRLQLALKLINR